jgi:hypothetical protein
LINPDPSRLSMVQIKDNRLQQDAGDYATVGVKGRLAVFDFKDVSDNQGPIIPTLVDFTP